MLIVVHVRPNASREEVGGEYDGALVVRVCEPPEDGKATHAVLRLLSHALGVPRRCVTLEHGATSRRKRVRITVEEGLEEVLRQRYEALCSRK